MPTKEAPIAHHLALFELPKPTVTPVTSIPLDPHADDGKRACQQIMIDMARFWLGEPVEYLALYVREW